MWEKEMQEGGKEGGEQLEDSQHKSVEPLVCDFIKCPSPWWLAKVAPLLAGMEDILQKQEDGWETHCQLPEKACGKKKGNTGQPEVEKW